MNSSFHWNVQQSITLLHIFLLQNVHQDPLAYSMMSTAVHYVVIHLSALSVGVSVTAPRRTATTLPGVLEPVSVMFDKNTTRSRDE